MRTVNADLNALDGLELTVPIAGSGAGDALTVDEPVQIISDDGASAVASVVRCAWGRATLRVEPETLRSADQIDAGERRLREAATWARDVVALPEGDEQISDLIDCLVDELLG